MGAPMQGCSNGHRHSWARWTGKRERGSRRGGHDLLIVSQPRPCSESQRRCVGHALSATLRVMSREPTHAQLARELVGRAASAALSTHAKEPAGFPYGSLVAIAADDRGRPVLCISRLAEHTVNLSARSEASLLLTAPCQPPATGDPLAHGRVTLLGLCAPVPAEERQDARALFLARHADATRYIDFADFTLYRLEPVALRYVGGFGRMSWVSTEDYLSAG